MLVCKFGEIGNFLYGFWYNRNVNERGEDMIFEHAMELLENVVEHTAVAENTATQVEMLQSNFGFTREDLLEFGYSEEDIDESEEGEEEE